MKVFIDTSAFIAGAYPKDARHCAAAEKFESCFRARHLMCTSDVIVYETLNWLAVRLGPRPAADFGRSVWLKSPHLRIISLDAEDRAGALAVLEKFSQIPLSFADASSIHLFHRHRLDRMLAFDRHYVQANIAVL